MPFSQVSQDIIKRSFRNAVFIDDNMVEPYEIDGSNPSFIPSKEIYEAFRKNNCALEIYNYKNYDEWLPWKEYHVKRKDLLILDWILKERDDSYSDSLKILEHSIISENLHFVCLYTDIPEGDIESKVIYRIHAFFSNCDSNKYESIIKKVEYKIEEYGAESEEIKNSLKIILRDLDLSKNDRVKSKELLEKSLKILYDIDTETRRWLLSEIFKEAGENHKKVLINIGYLLNKCIISNTKNYAEIKTISNRSLMINNTVINIFNKTHIKPSELHSEFSSAILSGSNNFMTILGLEIRTLLMESSAFIGKEIDSIDEDAFFYHESKSTSKHEFFEFLKQIWREQSSSFLLKKELKILNLLEDYKKKNGTDERLKSIDWKNTDKHKNLAKLNYHYNILLSKRNDEDFIRFGDIFELYKKGYDYDFYSVDTFLLNITAHCDCIRPEENIKSNFFFVQGLKNSIDSMLKEGDEGYNSFIIHNNDYIAIKWSTKPYNFYIDQQKNHIGDYIPVNVFGSQRYIKYICTLKENYTQRITNQSFAHASRVGIYFTDLKPEKKN